MHRHVLTWIVLFSVIAGMFVQLPRMAAQQDAVLNTYGALVEVDALTKQQYVEAVEPDRLVEGAIRGLLLQLDPYSGYVSPRELPALERRTQGDFIGVGIEVGMRDRVPVVIAPIEGSPAAQAGVRPGDKIVAVNGVDTKGLSVLDVEERLGGRPGTVVHLRIKRDDQSPPFEIQIPRGPVTLTTVRGFRRLPNGRWDFWIDRSRRIGYVRVSSFNEHTMDEFDAALDELAREGVFALILDLRFNPGGLMHQAVEMADRFVSDGLILSTVTRRRAVHEYHATPEEALAGVPLIVLVNGASASSAEIVAGSLQDHGRALIVGERTFGKGSVQHLIRLMGRSAAVKLTVAYYRLPKGRIIHRRPNHDTQEGWGITPDVEVPLSDSQRVAIQSARAELDVPTANRTAGIGVDPRGLDEADGTPKESELPVDPQLKEALHQLTDRPIGT
jgi:carboxyl-terminal processing protease